MAKIYHTQNSNTTGRSTTWQIARAAQVEWLITCRDQAGTIQKQITLKPTRKQKRQMLSRFFSKAAQMIRAGFTGSFYQKRKAEPYQRFSSMH